MPGWLTDHFYSFFIFGYSGAQGIESFSHCRHFETLGKKG